MLWVLAIGASSPKSWLSKNEVHKCRSEGKTLKQQTQFPRNRYSDILRLLLAKFAAVLLVIIGPQPPRSLLRLLSELS